MVPRLVLLFSSIVCCILGCPDGYEDNGSGCFKIVSRAKTLAEAYKDCAADGAFLNTVTNAYQNMKTQQEAGSAQRFWLGLTCSNDQDPSSCLWDDGTVSGYHRFQTGEPSVSKGACVVMDTLTGNWMSSSCMNNTAAYGCQWSQEKTSRSCLPQDTYFRDRCFSASPVESFTSIQDICAQMCGVPASIHSLGENQFVTEVGSFQSDSYSLLGLKKTAISYVWLDETYYNYSNFGYENRNSGECVSLALRTEEVPLGKWTTSPCSGSGLVVVCEKNLTNPCDNPPMTTYSPLTCTGTTFYSGTGQIYSPGYPLGNSDTSCEYVITEDENTTVSLTFSDMSLNDSKIFLYSTFFDAQPFAILPDDSKMGNVFISPTNILKMVYEAGSGGQSTWKAMYGVFGTTTTSPPPTIVPPTPSISCSFVLDWSYMQSPLYYSSHQAYLAQRALMYSTAQLLFTNPTLTFAANFAGFGYVDQEGPQGFPDSYLTTDSDFLNEVSDFYPVDGSPTTLCHMINLINIYTPSNGTLNPCLVFFSAEQYLQFDVCSGMRRTQFSVVIGAELNGTSGVSLVSTQTVAISQNFDQNDADNLAKAILHYAK